MPPKIAAALASLALATGLTVLSAPASAAAPGCPALKIFELGGAGHGGGEDYDAFNATVPPDVQTEKVVYPAEIAPYPGHDLLLDQSVAIGVANLDRAVRAFHAMCGESRVTITGYSLGALVAGDELDNLVRGNENDGPPVPGAPANPYVMFDGDIQASQDAVRAIRDATRAVLPPEAWRQLVDRFPWLDRL